MKNFNCLGFYGFTMPGLAWLRWGELDYGLALKCGDFTEAERALIVLTLPLLFGWRVALMRAP